MAIKSIAPWCLVLVAALLGVGQANAALLYHVSIITTSVSGDAVMFFDLTNFDPSVDHSVKITAFSTDGTLLDPPVLDPPENVSGTLAGSVLISDSSAALPPPGIFTYSQGITLGTAIAFDFQIFGDMSPAVPPATADGFVFSLFGSGGDPLLSDDGVLLLYSIGEEDPLQTFSDAVKTSTEEISDVPEPGAPALLVAGLLALGLARSVRNSLPRKTLTA